ncbi:MAG: winged helix-turn-helix transcriptional regulator [Candidatus Aenigmatarchaeota archaeon]
MLKKREREVFIQLLENARVPDKHIAKLLNITQPTVTRIRQRLEKMGYIKKYKPVVDFQKLGMSLVALTLFRIADFSKIDVKGKMLPDLSKMPQVFLLAQGEGMGKTSVVGTIHKSFSDFEEWMASLRKKHGKYMEDVEHFIFSINKIQKEFSLEDAVIDILRRGQLGK